MLSIRHAMLLGCRSQHYPKDKYGYTKPMDGSPEAWRSALLPYAKRLYELLPDAEKEAFAQVHGTPLEAADRISAFSKELLFYASNEDPGLKANGYFWGAVAPSDLPCYVGTGGKHLPTYSHRLQALRQTLKSFGLREISLLQIGEVAHTDFFSSIETLEKEGLYFRSIIAIDRSLAPLLHARACNRLSVGHSHITFVHANPVTFLETNQEELLAQKPVVVVTESSLRVRGGEDASKLLGSVLKAGRGVAQTDMIMVLETLRAPK